MKNKYKSLMKSMRKNNILDIGIKKSRMKDYTYKVGYYLNGDKSNIKYYAKSYGKTKNQAYKKLLKIQPNAYIVGVVKE